MFEREFAAADMTCIVEAIHEAGEVVALEWRDPLGLRGCGFFPVRDDQITFQRGYWDKLSFCGCTILQSSNDCPPLNSTVLYPNHNQVIGVQAGHVPIMAIEMCDQVH